VKDNRESVLDILAALLVLFTAMLDPRLSVGLAVVFLVALALYKFRQSREQARG
jgi:hypothetical protein